VFINKKTKRAYATISKQWDIFRKTAEYPHLRIHDPRHQFASLLINEGVSLYTVEALLGHALIATTERYSHLTIASMASVSSRVSDVLNGAMPKPCSNRGLPRCLRRGARDGGTGAPLCPRVAHSRALSPGAWLPPLGCPAPPPAPAGSHDGVHPKRHKEVHITIQM